MIRPATLAALLCLAPPALAQDEPEADVEEKSRADLDRQAAAARSSTVCRRLVGFTGGFTTDSRSWAFLGQGPVHLGASPTFAMSCDVGPQSTAWSVGVEASPFYVTRRIGDTAARARSWLSVSTGVVLGSATLRGGPLVSLSWGRVGAGARLLHLPWSTQKGVPQGIEYRLIGYYNGGFEMQAFVMYTITASSFVRKAQ